MATIKTRVRLLEPGDVLLDPLPGPVGGAARYVVLCAAVADPSPVCLQLGRLGDIPAHLDRVATVAWIPDALAIVDRPDLTPVQAGADQLLEVVRSVSRGVAPHPDTAFALLDEIDPPFQAEMRFDRVTPTPDGTFRHSYRGRAAPRPEAAGMVRIMSALALLEQVEHLDAGGHVARVQILHDEVEVSSATVHENVAAEARRKLEEARDNLAAELIEERNHRGAHE